MDTDVMRYFLGKIRKPSVNYVWTYLLFRDIAEIAGVDTMRNLCKKRLDLHVSKERLEAATDLRKRTFTGCWTILI